MPIQALIEYKEDRSGAPQSIFIHTASHDMESLFYVLIWICTFYCGPGNQIRKLSRNQKFDIHQWIGTDPRLIADLKSGQMGRIDSLLDDIDPYFSDMRGVLKAYHRALWNPNRQNPDDYAAHVNSRTLHAEISNALLSGINTVKETWEAR